MPPIVLSKDYVISEFTYTVFCKNEYNFPGVEMLLLHISVNHEHIQFLSLYS